MQARHNATSEGHANSLPTVENSSHLPPSGQPDHVSSGDSGNPAIADAYPARSPNQPSRSARQGFRRVRDPKDLQPHINPTPVGRAYVDGIYLSPLRSLTTHIIQTFMLCNPWFHYESTHNPRRVLTKPSKRVYNGGYDNEDHDYIFHVNDVFGPDNQYLVLDDLGQGRCSWVLKCQHVKSKEIVAIKVVKNETAHFQQSMTEISILELLNTRWDPNDEHHIVRLKNTFIHKNHICLVFELLSDSLREISKHASPDGFRPHLVSELTSQLLDAMTVLNEARLIHRDLNPDNILLINLKSPRIKIIDFGSACYEKYPVGTGIQSLAYRSLEELLGMPYDSAVDMWSLGCIVVGFVLDRQLFSGTREYDQVTQIVETLGMPPPFMLQGNKRAREFFSSHRDQRGRERYYLRSVKNYSQGSQKNEQSDRKQPASANLPDMIRAVARDSKSGRWAEDDGGKLEHVHFVLTLWVHLVDSGLAASAAYLHILIHLFLFAPLSHADPYSHQPCIFAPMGPP
ncbi:dual specificity protein kinase yak1 [Ceratobasidium sp. 414]|nr:dual specificity protein kinase yak1 [Ceratobasidium sp. 414]